MLKVTYRLKIPGGLRDGAWPDGRVEDAEEPDDEAEDRGRVHGRPVAIWIAFDGRVDCRISVDGVAADDDVGTFFCNK